MDIKKVFVMGSGQMGAGIAQVSAQAGYDTYMCDISDEILEKAQAKMKKGLDKLVSKEKIDQARADEILSKLTPTTDLGKVSECDYFIEAVPEIEDLKLKIFKDADEAAPEHTILATNTSAIPISLIAGATNRPEKVIGTHFMNPVPIMKLVEIILAYQTNDETHKVTEELMIGFGKEIVTAQDFPGFITTRMILPFMNECMYLFYEGQGTKEDIDKSAKLAFNHPMGPFEWIDFVGIDTILNILKNLHESHGSDRYFPCPIMQQMVNAGHLGRKSGRGFYDYTK